MVKTDARKYKIGVESRRPLTLVLAIVGVGMLLWGAWAWWSDQSYRDAITSIELDMANGRFGIAARQLNELLEREPGAAEAAILLGRCEQERGRYKAAAQALARVAPGSELSHKAILARMRLFHDQGQFAAAEELITDATADPRNDRAHVRVLLVPIYSQLGRVAEAQRLLEDWWEELNRKGEGAYERAIDQVHMHIELFFKPNPIENVRAYLDQAFRMAPDDDRVWLGRANLAIRTGEYDEAKRWIDDCLRRRPEDVPVWRARLNWGMAMNQSDVVQQALKHLPAGESTPAEVHRLGAWLCARQGDHALERKQLERLVAADPADLTALDRLTQLSEQVGQHALAIDYRRRKEEIERLQAQYRQLFDRNQPIRDAEEMAGIAEKLGRTFEARGFLTVEISEDPERSDLRIRLLELSQKSALVERPVGNLADAVARALGNDARSVEKTAIGVNSPLKPG
jgi:tetratricopeptide (TPR) repeat protein